MTTRLPPRPLARPTETVTRRLRELVALSEVEEALVRGLGERRERHFAGDMLVAEGALDGRPRFILSGWACRQRILPDGRRQIFSFLLPGDSIAITRRSQPEVCAVVALTALETGDAQLVVKAAESGRAPGLAYALAALEPQEQSLLLDHMVRLGRQTAYERTAHFLIELQRRLKVVGLGDERRFPLPLTQEMMGDALGLSIVHVNRILQQLRRDGLIELRSGVAILLEPEQLAAIADARPQMRSARLTTPSAGRTGAAPA